MKISLAPKTLRALEPTDIVYQTLYWGQVKSQLGWKPLAFDIGSSMPRGDVLVLTKSLGINGSAAYVPQGPEFAPAPEDYGAFLENLSEAMAPHLDPSVTFIRYDLPWESQYAGELQERNWHDYPESRLREMRMNFGTRSWNLRKATVDMTVADTLVVDIGRSTGDILARMKAKTRYNIGLAQRKGVKVFEASPQHLPAFHEMFRQTAIRNGFSICDRRHFCALFAAHEKDPSNSEIVFLLATHHDDLLAGAIVAISGKKAIFLYGASSNIKRNLMGPYAVHWAAIQKAKFLGCTDYDMGAVSPTLDPEHSFYGLYRFKVGFGGRIVHRSGSWDFPLNEEAYSEFRNCETVMSDTLAQRCRGCA